MMILMVLILYGGFNYLFVYTWSKFENFNFSENLYTLHYETGGCFFARKLLIYTYLIMSVQQTLEIKKIHPDL